MVVQKLQDYIAIMEEEFTSKSLRFRGQSFNAPLVPKIGRLGQIYINLQETELDMIREFKRKALPFIKHKPASELEWLTLAQHYGLSTRLLDWTSNYLVALWFAVENIPVQFSKDVKPRDGVVYVFDPPTDYFVRDQECIDPFKIQHIKVFDPNHITQRIVAQAGSFTIHPMRIDKRNFDFIDDTHIRKIIIKSENFASLRSQLVRSGISAEVLFPGLEGVCREIVSANSYTFDDLLCFLRQHFGYEGTRDIEKMLQDVKERVFP